MDQLKPVEEKLSGLFKNLPELPEQTKKSIAKYFEWVAIIFGVLQVIAVIGLWNLGHRVNNYAALVNEYSRAFNGKDTVPSLGIFYYIALIGLAASAVTLLLAYPGLKARKKIGWDWLFVGTLVNLVYGIAAVFMDGYYGGGFGRLVSALLGSAISFYLLYQVRNLYMGHHTAKHVDAAVKK